jgi:DNA-binding transcriptional MerR regulator
MIAKRTIGVLSRETGVKVTTIRYYESIALLDEPDRTASGQRVYGSSAVQTLTFIRHARDLGFSIDAIRKLIRLDGNPDAECSDANRIAQEQLSEVETKIEALNGLRSELLRMLDGCGGTTLRQCEIIQSLRSHDRCIGKHTRLGAPISNGMAF